MTNTTKTGAMAPKAKKEAAELRVRPAEFARMLGKSRQSVSDDIKAGKITLGSDGLLSPPKALAELLRNTDPLKVRARVLRNGTEERATLERRIADLEEELTAARGGAAVSLGALFPALLVEMAAGFLADDYAEDTKRAAMMAACALEAVSFVWGQNSRAGNLWESIPDDSARLLSLPLIESRASDLAADGFDDDDEE